MTDVERLTIPHAGHERKRTQYGDTAYWTQASKFDMMNRLGEYEDTGYSPEELRGILRKAKVAPGDRVEYAGGVWEVTGFDMNAVCLERLSEAKAEGASASPTGQDAPETPHPTQSRGGGEQ